MQLGPLKPNNTKQHKHLYLYAIDPLKPIHAKTQESVHNLYATDSLKSIHAKSLMTSPLHTLQKHSIKRENASTSATQNEPCSLVKEKLDPQEESPAIPSHLQSLPMHEIEQKG